MLYMIRSKELLETRHQAIGASVALVISAQWLERVIQTAVRVLSLKSSFQVS